MVLDSYALVAIHLREPGFEKLLQKIENAPVVAVGVPTLLESLIVLTSRLGYDARVMVSGFLKRVDAEIVPFTDEHLDAAMEAFLRFDRGRHPAGLNFGDCMTYATAGVSGFPLLYTGDDFARTDIAAA